MFVVSYDDDEVDDDEDDEHLGVTHAKGRHPEVKTLFKLPTRSESRK